MSFSACRTEIAGRPTFIAMMLDIRAQLQARRTQQQQQEELESLVERRTAELAAANATLQERAAAIADLYDHAPCGYHSVTPEGVVSAVNATELALLGYEREEFVGQPIARFLAPESRARFRGDYDEFLRVGQVRDAEYEMVRKDGSLLPVLVSAVLMRDAQGRHLSNRATLVDNSERKARERQIDAMQRELVRRADEAETATRAKSAFLANMSHEIRTPMNAIIGLTDLLTRDATDTQQHSRLTKIDGAARHLLQVINDILDLSKIEAGKLALEEIEFSLDQVLANAFELVGARAREKGLELVVDAGGVPDRLVGDPTRLAQALINLLSNAVKFTPRGWVRLRVQVLREEAGALSLRFEVRDTGEGIAPDVLPHLFAAFEQADSSTTRRHGGTGLGLALTRHIATLMGGEAGVESQLGSGSTFWFTARLARGTQAAPETAPVSLAGRRVLLVDDLPEALQALADRLQALGLQVEACAAPEEALARAAAEHAAGRAYDLLMLDWRMSPLDGGQTLQRLRTLFGGALPPSVLVSAADDDAMWAQSRQAGFDAVLLKPVSSSTLYDTLSSLLRHSRLRLGAVPQPPGQPAPAEAQLREACAGRRVLLAEDNEIGRAHV